MAGLKKEYKGVNRSLLKENWMTLLPIEHCRSVRIIRNGSYTTRTQMLKVKEKLTILELNVPVFSLPWLWKDLCENGLSWWTSSTNKGTEAGVLMELYEINHVN